MATPINSPQAGDYQLLGLTPDAGIVAIKRAYRKLAKQWHPDHHRHGEARDQELAEQRFREISRAYQRLLHAVAEGSTDQPQNRHHQAPAASRPVAAHSSPGNSPRATQTTGHRQAGAQPSAAFPDRLHWALSARGRRYVGLTLGLLVSIGAFLLLSQPPPPPPRTVVPALGDGGSVLMPPKDSTPSTAFQAPSEVAASQRQSEDRPAFAHAAAEHFSLGATPDEVLRTQGSPNRIVGSTWSYGLSAVQFRQGRVQNYNNFDGRLRVRVLPTGSCDHSALSFSLGSSIDQVLCVQGTPSKVDGNRWYYGLDMIRFKHHEVVEYSNSSGNLKVQLGPKPETASGRGPFRIGSNKNEVLSIQDTPMAVRNNTWYYRYSDIQFSHDRVRWVNDPAGQLHFMAGTETP